MQEKVEELVDHVKEYVNTQYELAILKASNKTSHMVSGLVAILIVAVFTIFALVLLSFAAAYYLSDSMGNSYSGFVLVGGIYLLLGLLILAFRKNFIEKPLTNKLIRSFFKEV